MIVYRVQWRNLNRKDSKIHLEYILNNNNLSHSRCSSSKKGENSPWRNRYSDQNTLAIHYPKPWKTCSKILQPSKTANPQDPPYLFRPSLYHHFGTKSRIFQAREGRWGKIFRDWPRQGTRPEGGNRNQPLFVATSCHLSAPVRSRKGVETGGWTDGGCRSPVGGGKLEKDLEEGGGEEGTVGASRNQRSQKSFSRLLPRPARLNFFSAQEFSYYSEFQAAYRAHIHAQCTGGGCGCVRLKSSPSHVTQRWGWEVVVHPLRIAEEEISFHRRTPTLGEIEFIRNHGLWVRDHSSRKKERLFPFGCQLWEKKLFAISKPFEEDLSWLFSEFLWIKIICK